MSVGPLVSSPKTAQKKTVQGELKQTNKRKVRFNERVKRRHIQNIPEEFHSDIWYQSSDYSEARRKDRAVRETISIDKELFLQNEEELNALALLTEEQFVRKCDLVEASIDDVLDEQDAQEKAFYNVSMCGPFSLNGDEVAKVYRSHSQLALDQAQDRAIRIVKHLEHECESKPCSPSRFIKKEISTCQSPRSAMKLPRPPVFVPEGTSEAVMKCITQAA